MAEVTIYTDGSSRGNPGPGGYGLIMMSGQHRKEFSEGFKYTTNNRMELLAVIKGIELLKGEGHKVTIYSDSQYVVNAVTKGWLQNWIKKNFDGKKNADLWMRYYRVSRNHNIQFVWVKGHADNPFNNRCDELAVSAATGSDLKTDAGMSLRDSPLFDN
jgi:ribonuclease HI